MDRNIVGKRFFLIVYNFFAIFFWNFLVGVECERNSGLKLVSPFLGLSQPVLAKNIAEKRFFDFLNFFALFFGILLPGSGMSGIRN